ncbi:MAG: phage scaffolding protein [Gammaproteobacteria bacterium]|nr:phage scaffolding protein [Gammaproteobacteria bacterium]MDH5802439.1 phage scaffolding protein [Gammaproteobacteria bacterium]
MARKHRRSPPNIHESFSDIALLMLATFVFLLVTIMITSKMAEQNQLPTLKKDVADLQNQLQQSQKKNRQLMANMDNIANMTVESQMEQALMTAGFGKQGKNRKDFDLFVSGLKNLPGDSIHLMVDATGSMHGVTSFIIPILRVIVIRSGKRLDALTWFSDNRSQTYQGSMGDMFDHLMSGAPFMGSEETIGRAFRDAAKAAPAPGAYILIGDEPSSDRIHYFRIPSPVFTIPLGHSNPDTNWAFQKLADETGGKMLRLELK